MGLETVPASFFSCHYHFIVIKLGQLYYLEVINMKYTRTILLALALINLLIVAASHSWPLNLKTGDYSDMGFAGLLVCLAVRASLNKKK